MQVDNITRLNLLFDFYSVLLTDKQREFFELHYQYDLSLGEIAENFSVSRQAVHDLLRRTISQLENYEQRLQLVVKHHDRQQLLDTLVLALDSNDDGLARELTGRLKNF
jgi:predicted DNA-binding protein YlxM (UPF0122 family)